MAKECQDYRCGAMRGNSSNRCLHRIDLSGNFMWDAEERHTPGGHQCDNDVQLCDGVDDNSSSKAVIPDPVECSQPCAIMNRRCRCPKQRLGHLYALLFPGGLQELPSFGTEDNQQSNAGRHLYGGREATFASGFNSSFMLSTHAVVKAGHPRGLHANMHTGCGRSRALERHTGTCARHVDVSSVTFNSYTYQHRTTPRCANIYHDTPGFLRCVRPLAPVSN